MKFIIRYRYNGRMYKCTLSSQLGDDAPMLHGDLAFNPKQFAAFKEKAKWIHEFINLTPGHKE